jgi:polyisoprenoid-binding protein YceI
MQIGVALRRGTDYSLGRNGDKQILGRRKLMPWEYDFPHSRIGFAAKHIGVTIVHGYFQKADVKLDLNEADPTKSSLDVSIDAASLTSAFPRRDDAVIGENYLDAPNFPTIRFVSKRIEPRGENRYDIVGDFTLHGVTKELALDTTYGGEVTDPRGNTIRGLAARATISKKEFGIKGSPADPLAVSDEIQIIVDAELHKHD